MQPRAVLLDLDDTILDDSSLVDDCWRQACLSQSARLDPDSLSRLMESIRRTSEWYWSDPERHRLGRLDLDATRCEVVRLALLADLDIDDPSLAAAIGGEYARRRDVGMTLIPEAVDTVRWLKSTGRALALLTNGGGPAQRKKIERFGLSGLFDAVLVEGELGFGKPDARIYAEALRALDVQASDAWMIGDHLDFDVLIPQRLGLTGVWIDIRGRGVPPDRPTRPHHIVHSLSAVKPLLR